MPRRPRILPADVVQHVMNRGSRRGVLFESDSDHADFLRLVSEARDRYPLRIVAHSEMPTHFHFLLWPREDDQVSRFMHWLTGTHARLWREARRSQGEGAVYQSRFRAVPIYDVAQLVTAWRYVERNPVEAGLVQRAEDWRWSSASLNPETLALLQVDAGPIRKSRDWLQVLNDSTWEITRFQWQIEEPSIASQFYLDIV